MFNNFKYICFLIVFNILFFYFNILLFWFIILFFYFILIFYYFVFSLFYYFVFCNKSLFGQPLLVAL